MWQAWGECTLKLRYKTCNEGITRETYVSMVYN